MTYPAGEGGGLLITSFTTGIIKYPFAYNHVLLQSQHGVVTSDSIMVGTLTGKSGNSGFSVVLLLESFAVIFPPEASE